MLSANRGFKTQAWVQEIEVSAGTVTCKKKHQLCADSAYPTQCKIDLPYLSGAFCCWQLARGQLDRQERRRLFGRHQSPISIAKTRKGSAAPFALAALRPCRRRRRRLRNPNPSGYGNVRACVHTCARAQIEWHQDMGCWTFMDNASANKSYRFVNKERCSASVCSIRARTHLLVHHDV